MREDESVLTKAIIDLATEYGRYGYRRVTALLHRQGWQVNHKRVERIWRREGLKVACPRISVHLVKRIPLVSHTPSDSHIPASSGGVWDCKTAQYN